MIDIAAAAERLDVAALDAVATEQFGDALGLEDAYRVQGALIARRLARGERRIGVKLGFTSRAKMIQMGVDDLIWGKLTDAMLVEDGGEIDLSGFIHPRVEPELAFLIGRRLAGRVSMLEAQAAISAVAPAMEIIDSRYRDFQFSLADVVADNTSGAALVVGAWRSSDVDISNLGMVMSIDGVSTQIGSTAAILGHPLRTIVAAARLAGAAGEALEPGDIVLAGAATAAEPLRAGIHVMLEAQHLGLAAFSVAV